MKLKTLQLEIKFYQTQEFKELETQWYQKLREDGFKDEERKVSGDLELKQNSHQALNNTGGAARKSNPHSYDSIRSYFRILCQCLNSEFFDSELDRLILGGVSEGKKIKEISEELKRLGHVWHRQTIRFRIRKYENKFGLRSWESEKLNPPWKNGRKKAVTQ